MKIKLAKKLASMLDGVDVSRLAEGEAVDLPARDAAILIAEGWAVPADEVRQHSDAERKPGDSDDRSQRDSRRNHPHRS